MEKQPSAPPSPVAEHQLDEKPAESSEEKTTPRSGRATAKISTLDNAKMPRVTLFPLRQHSVGPLEVVPSKSSKSSEVLRLASVADVDTTAIENLSSLHRPRRRFVVSFRSRKKPPEIVQEYVTAIQVFVVIEITFIHSDHFYSTSSSPLLLKRRSQRSTDTVPEFHPE